MDNATRQRVIEVARDWIGTPYHHQASLKGIGCDCLGLLHGIYFELYGKREKVPPYTPDWGDSNGKETLLEAGNKYLQPIDLAVAQPGDVLAFRWLPSSVAKHVAIKSYDGKIIHAHSGAAVCEVTLARAWERRLAAAFSFKVGQ